MTESKQETPPNHYVDNKALYNAIVEYKNKCLVAKSEGKPKPKIPNYIGDCILKIAENLSYRHNFNRYSYREEMIADGIENCILYFDNFNPEKYKSPFNYFTTILYYAYTRRITKEQKQTYVKHKLTMKNLAEGMYDIMEMDEDVDIISSIDTQHMNDFIKKYEEGIEMKKTKRAKKKGVERFCDDEDNDDDNDDSGSTA